MHLPDHWWRNGPKHKLNKSQWAAERNKLKCEGAEMSIYKQNQLPQLHWGSRLLSSLVLLSLGTHIKVTLPVLLTCNRSKTILREKLKTKQTAPADKQLLEHGKQTLAKLRCESSNSVAEFWTQVCSVCLLLSPKCGISRLSQFSACQCQRKGFLSFLLNTNQQNFQGSEISACAMAVLSTSAALWGEGESSAKHPSFQS